MKKIDVKCKTYDNLNPRIYRIINCTCKSITYTDLYGDALLYLEENRNYNLVIDTYGYKPICIKLNVSKDECLFFCLYKYINKIYLNDYNYPNLKIERGIINLWPNRIQSQ